MGSLGPKDINPETKQPYGLDLVITIRDMVEPRVVASHLGIKNFYVQPKLNGWYATFTILLNFSDKAFSAIPIACSSSHSAQNIALNELARQAIMADPVWDKDKYVLRNVQPKMDCGGKNLDIWLLSEKGIKIKKIQESRL